MEDEARPDWPTRRRWAGLTKGLRSLSRGFGRLSFVGVKSDPAQRSQRSEVK